MKRKSDTIDCMPVKSEKKALNHLQNLVISAFSALGPIGSVFSSALLSYLTTKRLTNIQNVLDAMAGRLDALSKKDLGAALSSDQFLHLCITAMEKAQKEHREAKRKCYGVMLANMAGSSEFKYDLFDHFLSLLGDMSDIHMALLTELAKHGVQEKDSASWVTFKKLADIFKNQSPRPPTEIVASALQKLAAYGIVKTKGTPVIMTNTNPVGLWHVSSYSITSTGQDFVKFLIGT